MSFLRWIAEKVVLAILFFFAFYLVASTLGILPQPDKDFVVWFQGEFNILLLVICFLVAAYVAIKVLSWKQGEKKGEYPRGNYRGTSLEFATWQTSLAYVHVYKTCCFHGNSFNSSFGVPHTNCALPTPCSRVGAERTLRDLQQVLGILHILCKGLI